MDPADLWDFDDPPGSEQRFRTAADQASGVARAMLLTQVARALGLQARYDDAHTILDRVEEGLDDGGTPGSEEVEVRVALERGRLHRSAGDPRAALPLFEEAAHRAAAAALSELEVDALHMVALAVDPTAQVSATERALAAAYAATDPRARDWDASLLNNLGMAHAGAGDFGAALTAFRDALAAAERIGDAGGIRIARWMVAWALRNLGRRAEALEIQHSLRGELDAAGLTDPYVDEELALLDGEPQVRS